MTAQPVQAAAASGPDAADWDAQAGADLRVRCRRVLGEQGDQLLVARGQLQERLVQRGVALGRQQLLLGRSGLLVRDVLDVVVPCRVSAYSLCCRMAYGLM